MADDYFRQRDNDNMLRLRKLRRELPSFCDDFFRGIENTTSLLTRVGYAYDLRIFFDFLLNLTDEFDGMTVKDFKVYDLNRVTLDNLEFFVENLSLYSFKGKEYSDNERAKARKIATIRSFFKYFYNKGLLEKDVAAKIRMPKLHDKPIIRLDVDEVADLLDIVDGTLEHDAFNPHQKKYLEHTKLRDTAILTLLLGTGIRVSECVGLNVEDIDFKNNAFTVTRKGGNRTILYFSDEVAETLLEYVKYRIQIVVETSALFLSLQNKRISVRAVQLMVKKYAQVATPLKKITPHKLRSTYGTNLYNETGDIYVVADVLGHKDVNTTKKHYAALSDDIRKKAARKVQLRDKKSD